MYLVEFILLFLAWILFSGRLDGFHLALGAVSAALVVYWSSDLMFQDERKGLKQYLRMLPRVAAYSFWLLKEVLLANVYVLKLALHPRLKEILDPRLFVFKSEKLDNEFAHFVFANSITLTPGTVTVGWEDGVYTVHAISEQAARGLPSPMENWVAWTFNIGDDE